MNSCTILIEDLNIIVTKVTDATSTETEYLTQLSDKITGTRASALMSASEVSELIFIATTTFPDDYLNILLRVQNSIIEHFGDLPPNLNPIP